MAITKAKNTPDSTRVDPGRTSSDINAPKGLRKPSRKNSRGRGSRSSSRLTKAPPSKTRDLEKTTTIPPVPTIPRNATKVPDQFNEKIAVAQRPDQTRQPLAEVPANRDDVPSYYFQNPISQSSIQPEHFTAIPPIPTLQGRRSLYEKNMPRRKSSKRKAEDQAREQEIRALSSPIPIPKRPQSDGGGLLARESKRIPGGLNRNFERPASEVSIPLPESMHSGRSGDSDSHAFKISPFDALSPRPTIRYSDNPRYAARPSSLGPSRTSTRKDKGPSIPEESFSPRDRIDDLADELDARDLRELMERDRRRRDKKRRTDQEKLQRRLQRRAEKQKAAEGVADQSTSDRRGRALGDSRGLGIAELPALRTDSPNFEKGRNEARSPGSWLEDASVKDMPHQDPFVDPMSESHLEEATPEEKDEPILETAKAVRLSAAGMSPPSSPIRTHIRGPSNLSTLNDLNDLASRSTPDVVEKLHPETARDTARRGSDTSSRVASSWASFFKRSGTRGNRNSADRGRATPSEFSNTSRESFARQGPPPSFVRNVRARSGTPVRTQSKFREDLPELPISPPASRVQSPDLPSNSPYIDHVSKLSTLEGAPKESAPRLSDVHPAYRDEVAQSIRGASPDIPATGIMSQSLASVDSEGSWLSGRPPKRSSQQLNNPLRSSGGSLSQQMHGEVRDSDEERGVGEGTSINRSIPSPLGAYVPGYLTQQINAESAAQDDESDADGSGISPDEAPKINRVVGRHPTIIRRSTRAKSREGLLDDYLDEDSSPTSPAEETPIDPTSRVHDMKVEGAYVHRARSVDYGKGGHARHISAGSAKLLDLPPRSSTENKRLSSGSGGERSPLRTAHETVNAETPVGIGEETGEEAE
ncbi:hypothetical protein MMC19_003438 [Ptychographa xylographoides]|nr:hypothetical protein [Ptychographa xylographoides]